LIAGLALAALGGLIEGPSSEVLIAVGGALFGTSLGSFVGLLSNQAHEERLQDHEQSLNRLVREGVNYSFVSDDEKIEPYRIKWNLYHVTQMEGWWVWRKATLDFTKSKTPGRLTSRTYLLDENRKPQYYTVEAGRRRQRFIVFLTSETTEEPVTTYVFPFVEVFAPTYYGVVFLQSWDQTTAISPAIISSRVLHGHREEGTLPPEIGRMLDREWRNYIKAQCYFFPESTKTASLG
jgi:hypothetical protein